MLHAIPVLSFVFFGFIKMNSKNILGIDVGASGIKGAVVNLGTGELMTERIKIETPKPSTPDAVAEVIAELTERLGYQGGVIGCGFPSIIKNGTCHSAANIHASWKGVDVAALFSAATHKKVYVTNDADAAGISEMKYGKGKGVDGSVLLITIGSGLGSALFTDGVLVQNTEFGHIPFNGDIAEKYASNNARKRDGLTWEEFGKRFNEYLHLVEGLVSPNLIILGGGISKRFFLFEEYIDIETEVTPAAMFNHAGIIGAALYAYQMGVAKEKESWEKQRV